MAHCPKMEKKEKEIFDKILHSTIINMRREKTYNKLINKLKKDKKNYIDVIKKLKKYKNNNMNKKKINYFTLKKMEYIYGIKNIEFLFLMEINKIKYDDFYIFDYEIKRDLGSKKKIKYFICSNKNCKNYYYIFRRFLGNI